MSVRVLIADDQAVVRSGLRRIMDVDAEIEWSGRRWTAWPQWTRHDAWPRTSC